MNLGPMPEDPRLPFIRTVLQALDDSRADRYWMDTLFIHISNNPDRDHIVFGELCGEGKPVPSFRVANEVMCLDPISQAIGIAPGIRRLIEGRRLAPVYLVESDDHPPRGPTGNQLTAAARLLPRAHRS